MVKRTKKTDRFKEFLAEAEDILNSMGKGLLKLGRGVKAGVIDPAVLNGIFRSAHTLKGISGLFDLKDMASLSHALEDTLDMLRLGRASLTDEVLGSVMAAHALLSKILSSKGKKDFSAEVEKLKAELNACSRHRKAAPRAEIDTELLKVLTEYEEHRLRENLKEAKNLFVLTARFNVTSFDKGYAALIDLLKTEGEVIATLPSSKTGSELLYFDILLGTTRDEGFISALASRLTDVEIKVLSSPSARKDGAAPPPPEEQAAPAAGRPVRTTHHRRIDSAGVESLRRVSNTVRVDIDKLDAIMNVISELGILKSNVTRLSAEMKNEPRLSVYGIELSRLEKNLERKFWELRDSVLDVRMVPIGQLFNRFDTFIERLAREVGKEIRMTTEGDETELDKLIVEELADPIMHIIRNIADHALETPEARVASGKPRAGTIALSAVQKGNHVVIEVRDDGAGIDTEFVKKKALEKGLATDKELADLSERDVLDLIFLPGFSTRDVVSATSGRGVGMDVVKENITSLSGMIDIETEKGAGTRFILTIPITLAIIQALIVEETGRRYAVPLNSVVEIAELEDGSVEDGGKGEQEFITLNNRKVQSVRLSDFFGLERPGENPLPQSDGPACYGIVAGLAEQRLCLLVDRLIEELDVVIKPLPEIISVPGIAGATDMGEKGTVLVLDVTGILDSFSKERKTLARTGTGF